MKKIKKLESVTTASNNTGTSSNFKYMSTSNVCPSCGTCLTCGNPHTFPLPVAWTASSTNIAYG